jgi:hypothetical protein
LSRTASPEAQGRAHRNTKRTWSDRRLAAKLDELLGPVDEDEDAPPEAQKVRRT